MMLTSSAFPKAAAFLQRKSTLFVRSLSTTTVEALIRRFPERYLRDSDFTNFDASTHQRNDVFSDAIHGKPIIDRTKKKSYKIETISHQQEEQGGSDSYNIEWTDGHVSTFPSEWIQREASKHFSNEEEEDRVFWKNMTESNVRESSELSMDFCSAVSEDGMPHALKALYQYGILLVTNTPTNDGAGVAALGAALGGGTNKDNPTVSILASYRNGGTDIQLPHGTDGPQRTLYGTVWSTSSGAQTEGASVADSAYGHGSLPLHTDMTYMRDPPGLQIFTMVQPATDGGGASVFGDGMAMAKELQRTNPKAFRVLSTTQRRYRCLDEETGWNLQASGPIIQLEAGKVVQIRHNDLDRLPDIPPDSGFDDVQTFYESLDLAHMAWNELIAQDQFRLVMNLKPGDTVVVANHRCFHGRCSFTTTSPRVVMGCYVSQDELLSRFRFEGF